MKGVSENGVHYGRDPREYVDGRHFTDYVKAISRLKKQERYSEAEELLLAICDAMESTPDAPAPWYYEQLAIIYRKQKRDADEIAILQRGTRPHPQHRKEGGGKLDERLAKLLAKPSVRSVLP